MKSTFVAGIAYIVAAGAMIGFFLADIPHKYPQLAAVSGGPNLIMVSLFMGWATLQMRSALGKLHQYDSQHERLRDFFVFFGIYSLFAFLLGSAFILGAIAEKGTAFYGFIKIWGWIIPHAFLYVGLGYLGRFFLSW